MEKTIFFSRCRRSKSVLLPYFVSFFQPARTHTNTPSQTRSDNKFIPKQTVDLLQESSANQAHISLSLAKHVISSEAKDSNLVLSPLSIHIVLGLVASGSNGPTRKQIFDFLKCESIEEVNSLASQLATLLSADGGILGGPRLRFANGVWIDHSLSFKPTFKEIVHNSYRAASNRVDFQTKAVEVTKEVNEWAGKETNGLIQEILPPGSVNSYTRLVFANALYFKGVWSNKFDASMTTDHDFFLLNGTSIRVPFMISNEKQYVRYFDGFKVLRLPYEQGEDARKFSMYFFLPNAKDGLPDLVERVSSESGFIERHLPDRLVKVGDFRIPKFKFSFGFEASAVLKGLGLVLPFCSDTLTEVVDFGKYLSVSGIFHKSLIEVNEEGTEAAAVSAMVIRFTCVSRNIEVKLDFVADHPFLFVVREDTTGVVFFIGQVLDPLRD